MSKPPLLVLPMLLLAAVLGCDRTAHLARSQGRNLHPATAEGSAPARRTADTLLPIAMAEDSQRARELARTSGTLVGHVTIAGSRIPLPDVEMGAELGSHSTDSTGAYRIVGLEPGRHLIRASRMGYVPTSRVVVARAGRTDTLDWEVRAGPAACCRLAGTWTARLRIERYGKARAAPTSILAGSIWFADRYAPPADPEQRPDPTERVKEEFGRFQIDLSVLFGQPPGTRMPTGPFPGDTTFYTEAAGEVFNGDSVSVGLIPRQGHGSVAMWGVLRHDTIRGRWTQVAYHDTGPGGHFLMVRALGPGAPSAIGKTSPSPIPHRE